MTTFSLFSVPLFVIYSTVGHLGLLLASGASTALAFLLRQGLWSSLEPGARRSANRAGAIAALAVGAALLAGLRVNATAFDPSEPSRFWEWLTAAAAGLGAVGASHAATGALAALVLRRLAPGTPKLAEKGLAEVPVDEIQAAVSAFESLKLGVSRLRDRELEATRLAQAVSDGVAAAEYTRAAEAIHHRLQLAEELQSSTGLAVLRLACASPLRRTLALRPDEALARVNATDEGASRLRRVDEALSAVRDFRAQVATAQRQLQREIEGAPGSVALILGLDASERASPFQAALGQIDETYARVGHRLEALRLRLGAETDSERVAGAAVALTGVAQAAPSNDAVALAVEMTQAEQSTVSALTALGAEPSRIVEVVLRASLSVARESGEDEALAEVIRSVRTELASRN